MIALLVFDKTKMMFSSARRALKSVFPPQQFHQNSSERQEKQKLILGDGIQLSIAMTDLHKYALQK